METISRLGTVIKLTVLFNLMPAITGLCSSASFPLEFLASNYSDGGITEADRGKLRVLVSFNT